LTIAFIFRVGYDLHVCTYVFSYSYRIYPHNASEGGNMAYSLRFILLVVTIATMSRYIHVSFKATCRKFMWQVDVFMFAVTTDLQYSHKAMSKLTTRLRECSTRPCGRLLASSVISGLQSNPRVKNHTKSEQQKQCSFFIVKPMYITVSIITTRRPPGPHQTPQPPSRP
jgi:hypothetical protein